MIRHDVRFIEEIECHTSTTHENKHHTNVEFHWPNPRQTIFFYSLCTNQNALRVNHFYIPYRIEREIRIDFSNFIIST